MFGALWHLEIRQQMSNQQMGVLAVVASGREKCPGEYGIPKAFPIIIKNVPRTKDR